MCTAKSTMPPLCPFGLSLEAECSANLCTGARLPGGLDTGFIFCLLHPSWPGLPFAVGCSAPYWQCCSHRVCVFQADRRSVSMTTSEKFHTSACFGVRAMYSACCETSNWCPHAGVCRQRPGDCWEVLLLGPWSDSLHAGRQRPQLCRRVWQEPAHPRSSPWGVVSAGILARLEHSSLRLLCVCAVFCEPERPLWRPRWR